VHVEILAPKAPKAPKAKRRHVRLLLVPDSSRSERVAKPDPLGPVVPLCHLTVPSVS